MMTRLQKQRQTGAKSEETRARILNFALSVFRERGFERATMREIAAEAEVAVGAAYYYFESKEAIVMAFFERAQQEMKPALEAMLDSSRTLESRLWGIITEKFDYFRPDRKLLGALSAHVDPEHPLSPFSRETAAIRDEDLSFFERAVNDSKVKLPENIRPYLARLLWLYQMGLILFWVYDRSESQAKTRLLFDKTLKMLLIVLRVAGLPLLRPLHKLAGELLEAVYGGR
ncbi:MAG: TetR family transcriptional regulator [Acidobacteriaceae bacterium]